MPFIIYADTETNSVGREEYLGLNIKSSKHRTLLINSTDLQFNF